MRAGREALAREHLAQPRRRGEREAIRVLLTTRAGAVQARTKAINHLKHLVVSAPAPLRQQLRDSTTFELVRRVGKGAREVGVDLGEIAERVECVRELAVSNAGPERGGEV